MIKTFEVVENLPVRAARFVARKNWVVTGSVSCCTNDVFGCMYYPLYMYSVEPPYSTFVDAA